jgi:hypothetical protein
MKRITLKITPNDFRAALRVLSFLNADVRGQVEVDQVVFEGEGEGTEIAADSTAEVLATATSRLSDHIAAETAVTITRT